MGYSLTEINQWIADHQSLVVAVGVPALTAIAAGAVSWITTRANLAASRRARLLEAALILANFRQNWINDLREDLARYSALTWDKELQAEVSAKRDLVTLSASILMRLDPKDADHSKIRQALLNPIADPSSDRDALAIVSQGVLNREWEKLKKDLTSIDGEER